MFFLFCWNGEKCANCIFIFTRLKSIHKHRLFIGILESAFKMNTDFKLNHKQCFRVKWSHKCASYFVEQAISNSLLVYYRGYLFWFAQCSTISKYMWMTSRYNLLSCFTKHEKKTFEVLENNDIWTSYVA